MLNPWSSDLISHYQKLLILIFLSGKLILGSISYSDVPIVVFIPFLLKTNRKTRLNQIWNIDSTVINVKDKHLSYQLIICQHLRFYVRALLLVGFDAANFVGLALYGLLVFLRVITFPFFDPYLFSLQHHVIHLINAGKLPEFLYS